MLKTETKQIGDCEYEVTQLDAVRARRVFLKFSQLISPVLADVVTQAETKDLAKVRAAFIQAVAKVSNAMTPEDLDFFVDQFASTTSVVSYDDNGKKKSPRLADIQKLHFIGERFGDQFEWLAFCFEVNYASFFHKLGLSRENLQANHLSALTSRPESTGTSGAQ